jgi:hypothetical protein
MANTPPPWVGLAACGVSFDGCSQSHNRLRLVTLHGASPFEGSMRPNEE